MHCAGYIVGTQKLGGSFKFIVIHMISKTCFCDLMELESGGNAGNGFQKYFESFGCAVRCGYFFWLNADLYFLFSIQRATRREQHFLGAPRNSQLFQPLYLKLKIKIVHLIQASTDWGGKSRVHQGNGQEFHWGIREEGNDENDRVFGTYFTCLWILPESLTILCHHGYM